MPIIQLQFRRDTAARWTANNPLMQSGEMGLETDTGLFKIGDGTLLWRALPYGGLSGPTGPTGPGTSGTGGTGFTGPTGPTGIGSTGPTGAVTSYIFDGGAAASSYLLGPAFDCGNAS